VNVKAKLSMCLTKYHAMKTYSLIKYHDMQTYGENMFLCLTRCNSMGTCGGVERWIHVFLTLAMV